jgi:hypothetical protein
MGEIVFILLLLLVIIAMFGGFAAAMRLLLGMAILAFALIASGFFIAIGIQLYNYCMR